ncbi:hypothetical protein AB595_04560 [Massilia sp. WF1]|uniref:hypothetical protein n=1 Tax=unclassified Massilia TaxID=2609279 RepID=UPI00064A8D27|nr:MULTISPECIES: hypothetical protein [unclassified Massilia]ALK96950.1 hypothetical protein AM586_12465 [Massilia sp. WG5]KLU37903.1 hypothetical protein AB595_04560 [Massilia sp. WF1]
MLGFFKRAAAPDAACELGRTVVALAIPAGAAPPAACQAVVVGTDGRTRRLQAARRIEARPGETAYAFHPGPYSADLQPFESAPEIGLRTSFAVDAPDPQASQQRFDLYLASEVEGSLDLAALSAAIEAALRHELATGGLELPPCTTLDEWNAFRQGLNQLLYMRFGVTVDDCVPVDLGDSRDYARELAARLQARAEPEAGVPASPAPAPETATAAAGRFDPAVEDKKALRRLFLELPCLMCGLRLAAMPAAQEQFQRQQALLQRLDLVSVGVNAMPALELAAPGQVLALDSRLRRARHSRRACVSLDEAWALLARLRQAGEAALPQLYGEAERIVANLEADCAARRSTHEEGEQP